MKAGFFRDRVSGFEPLILKPFLKTVYRAGQSIEFFLNRTKIIASAPSVNKSDISKA